MDLFSSLAPVPDDDCIVEHNGAAMALSVFILVGMFLSYLPQHIRIINKGTSEGISPFFLLLGCTSATSTLFNIVILQWKVVQCCSVVSFFACVENMLGIAALAVQWTMFSIVFVLFMVYYPPYKKVSTIAHRLGGAAQSIEWKTSVFIAKVIAGHAVTCLVVTVSLLLLAGASSSWTSSWAGFLGVSSMVLATIQYVPQIVETFRSKVVGALSIPMMLMQTPGAVLIVVSLALRPGVNWTTWIVYAVTGTLQGCLLIMCIYFRFRAEKLGEDAFGHDEREPLLAAATGTTPGQTAVGVASRPAVA